LQKDILLVNGVPRSGTSAIGSMIGKEVNCSYRFQPLFSYKYRERAQEYKGIEGLNALTEELDQCDDDFIRNGMSEAGLNIIESSQTDMMLIKQVRYHEYLSGWLERKGTKLICVIRDPRACIYSQTSIVNEWEGSLDEYPDWINAPHINCNKYEYFGLAGWLRFCFIAEMLEKKYPCRVKLLRYEDFCSDNRILQQAVDDLDLPITLETDLQKRKSANTVYGVSARSEKDWKKGLSIEIKRDIEAAVTKVSKGVYLCD